MISLSKLFFIEKLHTLLTFGYFRNLLEPPRRNLIEKCLYVWFFLFFQYLIFLITKEIRLFDENEFSMQNRSQIYLLSLPYILCLIFDKWFKNCDMSHWYLLGCIRSKMNKKGINCTKKKERIHSNSPSDSFLGWFSTVNIILRALLTSHPHTPFTTTVLASPIRHAFVQICTCTYIYVREHISYLLKFCLHEIVLGNTLIALILAKLTPNKKNSTKERIKERKERKYINIRNIEPKVFNSNNSGAIAYAWDNVPTETCPANVWLYNIFRYLRHCVLHLCTYT